MNVLTLKQHRWVEETIKTLNPTEAARRAYNVKNDNTAKSIASENFTKPYLERAVRERMSELGMTAESLLKEHKKVLEQDDNLSAKNAALDMAYRLKGAYAPLKTQSVGLHFNTIEEIDEEMRKLTEEYNSLSLMGGESPHLPPNDKY